MDQWKLNLIMPMEAKRSHPDYSCLAFNELWSLSTEVLNY